MLARKFNILKIALQENPIHNNIQFYERSFTTANQPQERMKRSFYLAFPLA